MTSLGLLAVLLTGSLYTAWQWLTLPGESETLRLGSTMHFTVEKRPGSRDVALTGNRQEYSINSSIKNMPRHLIDAVIASEDRRFRDHGAFYVIGKFGQAGLSCAASLLQGGAVGACPGNSTITQQVAKLLLANADRGVQRKFTELIWALKMEHYLTKDQILEIYMNRVPLGGLTFGFEMASRRYFGKRSAELNLRESALLVASVRRPSANWARNPVATIRRANIVLDAMRRHGFLDKPVTVPADFHVRRGGATISRPFFGHIWSWVKPKVQRLLSDHPAGIYKVYTSINAEVQIYAQRSIHIGTQSLRRRKVPATQGSVMVMRPSGDVLAMIGGADNSIQSRYINRTVPVDGIQCRPPASLMKLVLYTAAIEKGMSLGDTVDASPFESKDNNGNVYRPINHDGKVYSTMSLLEAYVHSVNTAAVRLLADVVQFSRWFDVARRYGLPVDGFPRELGLALGQPAVCMVDMMRPFAIVASGGIDSQPRAILKVVNSGGVAVFSADYHLKRKFDRNVMENVRYLGTQVIQNGTGTMAKKNLPGIVMGGKTGTTDGFYDAWFMGYTKDLVVGVWIGNDMPTPMPDTYGGTSSALVFNKLMTYLVKHTSIVDLHSS